MNVPWYLQEPFRPARLQDLVLWFNSSSWDGTIWRNLASYSNVNHGTLMNGVAIGDLTHPSGVFGAPRMFDGSNDYVNCGNDLFNSQSAGTWSAWIKCENSGNYPIFTACEITSHNNKLDFFMNLGIIKIQLYTSSINNIITTDDTYNDGEWHNVVCTSDSTEYNLFVDGIYVNQTVTLGSNDGKWLDKMNAGTIRYYLGHFKRDTSETFFKGPIANIRTYNRALSAADIVHNYTHSPIYYMQHGIDPLSLLSQTSQQAAHLVV